MARQGSPSVRRPAVAGMFYPAEPGELREMVQQMLRASSGEAVDSGAGAPLALIVPHAGLIYSGPIAAAAYRLLAPFPDHYRRIALIGPAHRVVISGLAGVSNAAWMLPFGRVEVDRQAMLALRSLPFFLESDEAHAPEHCIEVQLPFLQMVLGDFSLVPLLAGRLSPDEVAEAITLLDDGSTLFIISSDLSHYHSAETARALDRRTCEAIEAMSPDRISPEHACGRIPVQGLLLLARRRHWSVRTLDLRNSGDTGGSRESVVGYGSWAFYRSPGP